MSAILTQLLPRESSTKGLVERGGRATRGEIVVALAEAVTDRHSARDLKPLLSALPRWQPAALASSQPATLYGAEHRPCLPGGCAWELTEVDRRKAGRAAPTSRLGSTLWTMAVEEERVIVCPHCDRPATAKIKGEAIWDGFNRDGDRVDPPTEWTLVQCTNCLTPSLQLREDYGRGFEDDEPVFVYPAPRRLSPQIPPPLRREWEEAKSCFDAKAYSACTVMVRRTIEGACMELGVKKRTLALSLKEMQSKGLIDGMLAEWASALRVAGNQGAHYTGEPVARDDAEDSLAFAEALLDHVYVLRKRFEAFKKRLDR